MAKVIARTGAVGIGKESTRGTAVAPSHWIPITSLDFDDKKNEIDNDSSMGNVHELNDSAINQLFADGNYEGKIFTESVGVELTALFGASPTSVQRTTTGVYDHSYAVANNNAHKSVTVAWKDSILDLRYALGMIDSWKLEASLDNYLRRTIGLIAKKSASAAGNTVAITNEDEFIPSDLQFYTATDLAGLAGASAVKIRNFTLEFSKNAEAQYVLGSKDPDDIINKQFGVSGSFEAYFEDTTHRDVVFAGTKKALRFEAIGPNTIGSSGSHKPALRFDIAKARYGEFERGYDSNDPFIQTINFDALWSIADASMITGRLTNAYAGTAY